MSNLTAWFWLHEPRTQYLPLFLIGLAPVVLGRMRGQDASVSDRWPSCANQQEPHTKDTTSAESGSSWMASAMRFLKDCFRMDCRIQPIHLFEVIAVTVGFFSFGFSPTTLVTWPCNSRTDPAATVEVSRLSDYLSCSASTVSGVREGGNHDLKTVLRQRPPSCPGSTACVSLHET